MPLEARKWHLSKTVCKAIRFGFAGSGLGVDKVNLPDNDSIFSVQAPKRQAEVHESLPDLVQACDAEVLAAEKLRIRSTRQLANTANIELLQTFSSTDG